MLVGCFFLVFAYANRSRKAAPLPELALVHEHVSTCKACDLRSFVSGPCQERRLCQRTGRARSDEACDSYLFVVAAEYHHDRAMRSLDPSFRTPLFGEFCSSLAVVIIRAVFFVGLWLPYLSGRGLGDIKVGYIALHAHQAFCARYWMSRLACELRQRTRRTPPDQRRRMPGLWRNCRRSKSVEHRSRRVRQLFDEVVGVRALNRSTRLRRRSSTPPTGQTAGIEFAHSSASNPLFEFAQHYSAYIENARHDPRTMRALLAPPLLLNVGTLFFC